MSEYVPKADTSSDSKPLGLQQIKVIETGEIATEGVFQAGPEDLLPVTRLSAMILAVRRTLKTKWFWYSIASSLCWTAWAFTAKLGSREIPPATMQFISAFGFVLVSLGIVTVKKVQKDCSLVARFYALLSGLLLALGGISLYGAYRTGYNASIITAITSLYPVVTVLVALIFLRERINRVQVLGLCFAAAAILILSF